MCIGAMIFRSVGLLVIAMVVNAQSFVPTGAMNESRFAHAAVLLNNGKVLVSGGLTGSGNSSQTAELYDPLTGTWRYTSGQMLAARQAHNMVKMLDGRVLVFGGHLHNPFTPVLITEIFDPVTETFSATGPMSFLHLEQPGVLLDDGRVMLVGASFPESRPSEIYDPASGTWTSAVPPIPVGSAGYQAVKLPAGQVLAMGGGKPSDTPMYPFVQRYDPGSNSVTPMVDLIWARRDLVATVLLDGRVLAAGGTDSGFSTSVAEVYDAAGGPNGVTQATFPMNEARRNAVGSLLPSGDVLVTGGVQTQPGAPPVSHSVTGEVWNAATGHWSVVGSMSTARVAHTSTALGNGAILITGGGTYDGISAHPSNCADLFVSPPVSVLIDIKPGSFPNSINLGSNGTVAVAILSTSSFDATTIDPQTITLASAPVQLKGKGTPMSSVEDVNGDGLPDLVVHVSTSALQLSQADTQADLEGATFGGLQVKGSDTVRVVP